MKNVLIPSLGILVLCSFCFVIGKKNTPPNICISGLYEGRKLVVGVPNPMRIVAAQDEPVLASQVKIQGRRYDGSGEPAYHPVKATMMGDSGNFSIIVDTVGLLNLTIETEAGVEEIGLEAIPFSMIVAGLGNNTNREKVKVGEFKVQKGIIARVTGTDMDAKCEVLGFQFIRISSDNRVQRGKNQGAIITNTNRPIFEAAKPGDIYWFRNIRYRCPGATEPQLADEFSIEIN